MEPPAIFKYIRLLSLDVVAGALSISFYFCVVFDVSIPCLYWLILGIATWLIYLVNNFANSYLPGNYSNKKELHQLRSLRILLARLAIACLLILMVIFWLLPVKIIVFGIAGMLFIVGYIIITQIQNYSVRTLFPRELIISLTFTAGTAGVPLLYNPWIENSHLMLIAGVFFLMLTNMLLFAILDYDHNRVRGIKSMAVRTSLTHTRLLAYGCAIISGISFSGIALTEGDPVYGLTGLGMLIPYLVMLLVINRISARYLLPIADAVLLVPLVLLLVKP